MRRAAAICLLGLFGAAAAPRGAAAEALDKTEAAKAFAKIVESNVEKFRLVKTLQYEGTRTARYLHDKNGLEEQSVRVKYVSSGEKYLFEYWLDTKPIEKNLSYSAKTTFDGETWSQRETKDNILHVSKGDRPNSVALLGYNFVFEAFSAFMFMGDLEKLYLLDKVSGYANPELWKTALGQASAVDAWLDGAGNPGINLVRKYKNPDSGEMNWKMKSSFSEANGMSPISWELLDEDGRLVSRYNVDEFTTFTIEGVSIPFAKKASAQMYDREGNPKAIFEYTVDRISVNEPVSDEVFSADLMEAKIIYDEDQSLFIQIPR